MMKRLSQVFAASLMFSASVFLATVCLYRYPFGDYAKGLFESVKQRQIPLLTIFTTIKETGDIPHHQLALNIVMTNWPSFSNYVRPVVFLNFTNSSLADKLRHAGWDVLQLEGTNEAGTPFLKDMFRTVFDRYESVLYGFANADIIFDDDLVKTLLEVQNKLKGLKNNVLLMGRRTNVDVDLKITVPLAEFEKHRLRDTATRKGKLFFTAGIDYFFFTNEGCSMNWSQIANVVIGRPAYDNYLLAMAIRHGVNVVDTTQTVRAVHISEPGNMHTGRQNKDGLYNHQVIGKFNIHEGTTEKASLNTIEDFLGNVFIVKR